MIITVDLLVVELAVSYCCCLQEEEAQKNETDRILGSDDVSFGVEFHRSHRRFQCNFGPEERRHRNPSATLPSHSELQVIEPLCNISYNLWKRQ